MIFGYARVSTIDQNTDLQLDQLKREGCEQILRETVSGAKADRPVLNSLLDKVRPGDTIVIWKLDRLGRSLQHLIELVNTLMEREVGLKSLQDPIDTTNAQGRLIFNIFASLAEFERDLIIERTQAGLTAARARGRTGGRPKGLTKSAEKKATAAAALYSKGELSVNEIAENLGISKTTLYKYLRHRRIDIGHVQKSTPTQKPKTLKVNVHMVIENNSKHVRGKSRSLREIEDVVFAPYQMQKPEPKGCEYELTIPYLTDKDLENTIIDLISEAENTADCRNGFTEIEISALDGSDRYWS
ncbi:MAG: recombinase family protein [Granulosicoccus sp.]